MRNARLDRKSGQSADLSEQNGRVSEFVSAAHRCIPPLQLFIEEGRMPARLITTLFYMPFHLALVACCAQAGTMAAARTGPTNLARL